MNAKCICAGAVCTCGAEGIVKDGHGVRLSVLAMDGSIGGEKHLVGLTDAQRTEREAYEAMKVRDSNEWRGQDDRRVLSDRAAAANKAAHDHAYAEARTAGLDDGAARSHAARAAMIHDLSNAWRA